MDPPASGCPLCASTWGNWFEEVDGRSTFFCCALCAKMWKAMRHEVRQRTQWTEFGAIDIEGNRWGRTCRAHRGDETYDFFIVFTPEGAVRRFEERASPPAPEVAGPLPVPAVVSAAATPATELPSAPPTGPPVESEALAPAYSEAHPAPPADATAPPSLPEEPVLATGLDPTLRARIAEEATRYPNLLDLPPAEGRKVVREIARELDTLAGAPAAVAQLRNTSFPAGDHRVTARVYTPVDGTPPLPVVLYFHGGGWVFGDLETADSVCREIADRSSCAVVSVAYRRSPEAKYPAAVEDAYAAVHWLTDPATVQRLEIDPARIVVAGDSVGGNLAAVVTLVTRERAGPVLAGQVLVCPVLDHAPDTPSMKEYATGFGLDATFLPWMWQQYLARPEDATHPWVAPLRAPDLSGLPPALILTAECDVLRDEAERYADRLAEAGVRVQSTRYAGMIHGFLDYRGIVEDGWEGLDEVATWLKATVHSDVPLAPPPPPPPPG